jgi:predicted acetyltransferase
VRELAFGQATRRELPALADVLSHAFGFPRDDALPWFERAKHENVRVYRRGDRIAGGLLEIPMGQFFGGRSVPTLGVAGVGVAPHERGAGIGARMMVAMLREGRTKGFPLSTLFPASITLYRRAGYERAGGRFRVEVEPRMMTIPKVSGARIAEVEGVPDELRALYGETARRQTGCLDRGHYIWSRILRPRGLVTKTFTVSFAGRVEGYVVVAHKTGDGLFTVVRVVDLAAKTERAARALLRLLFEYRSLATSIAWNGGPADPFVALLPERHHTLSLVDFFMLRIVDPAGALGARGYPKSVAAEFTVDLRDETMRENTGRYEVSVAGGEARVARSKRPAKTNVVNVTERGLAALYAGHMDPFALEHAGMLTAKENVKEMLATLFAGPPPMMRDDF